MKKTFSYFLLLFVFCTSAIKNGQAQKITPADLKALHAKEDTLKEYAEYLYTDSLQEDRMISDSIFTKVLVRALQIKNSFYYPFDSVKGVRFLYAPDKSFRIITWNLSFTIYYPRQKGAIQMRTDDGSLQLFPLRDVSEFTENPLDSARGPGQWIGAVYYNMIKTEYNGKNYYTLFGFDPKGVQSSMKWIEVLSFNKQGKPIFGGPFFTFQRDSLPKPPKYRIGVEFKKGARILVNYIPDEGMIFVDHLISETNQPDLPWTFIPDGDQEGYKWINGKWVHIDKVFTFKLKDGEAPNDVPILDKDGNVDEKKLEEKSKENKQKEKPDN
ncbi:MAG: hypothetical protein KDC06_07025 [Chitinophagaceae bacterium]|nr:hypothetical protein [Chitinophagaceae bacterium]